MTLRPEAALRKDITQPSGNDVFQHRHYAELARIIRATIANSPKAGMWLAHELARNNANFNRARFLAACSA